ncbi:hypothetical protein C0Q70_01350 [Pomacea canaliculata]|uniref:Uncharacterized protein n=1 Tax=Pomacea canaliculata TaxID=400727 RepID=A0A2T7PZ91_POMCA|nr:hypothetical protein C0Q70_01350 [Pomacea canaliculata]
MRFLVVDFPGVPSMNRRWLQRVYTALHANVHGYQTPGIHQGGLQQSGDPPVVDSCSVPLVVANNEAAAVGVNTKSDTARSSPSLSLCFSLYRHCNYLSIPFHETGSTPGQRCVRIRRAQEVVGIKTGTSHNYLCLFVLAVSHILGN